MSPTTRRVSFVLVVLYLGAVLHLNQEMSAARAALDSAGVEPTVALRTQVETARMKIFAVNSALMYYLLYVLLWPYLRDALDRGARKVVDEQRQAEVRISNAEEDLAEARRKLERIPDEAEALRKGEIEAGEAEAARMRELAERETRQVEENTEQGIHRERVLARRRAIRQVADRALERAMAELEGSLDDATRKQMSTELIERLAS